MATAPVGRRRGQVFSETSTALIPLRPLTIGEAMDAAFLVLRKNPRELVGLPIIAAIAFVFSGAVLGGVWWWLSELRAVVAQVLFGLVVVGLGSVMVGGIMVWMQGILTRECLHTVLGERLSVPPRRSWKDRWSLLWPMVAIALMVGGFTMLASWIAQLLVAILMGTTLVLPQGLPRSIGILVVWLASLFLSCFLYALVSQMVPIYIAEGPRCLPWIGRPRRGTMLGGVLGRSVSLVGWRDGIRIAAAIASTMVLVSMLAGLLSAGIILASLLFILSMRLDIEGNVISTIAMVAFGVSWPTMFLAAAAYIASLQTIFYLDLRMRREGLDLALRFPQVPVPEPEGV